MTNKMLELAREPCQKGVALSFAEPEGLPQKAEESNSFLASLLSPMKMGFNRKSEILAREQGTTSTARELLQYIHRVGMLHLNKNDRSRSVGNVWDWSKGDPWTALMGLMESRDIFLCKALAAKRTYASAATAISLIRLAGDRFAGLPSELHRAYELIRTEGPLTRRGLSDLCGYTAKDSRAILDDLVDRLLITVLEDTSPTKANWPQLAYWTVDEWMLDRGVDASTLQGTEKDEEIVLSAAAKCLMSNDPKELAKALAWPAAKVESCLERLPPAGTESGRNT